jgi:hypothetical protein
MTTSRTIRVISRLLNEQYKPAPTPPKRARKPLRSFSDVTQKLGGRTPVIISPRKAESENNTEINTSQRKLRKEAAPTNSMGASSSSQGPIQTFDPILTGKQKRETESAKEKLNGAQFQQRH